MAKPEIDEELLLTEAIADILTADRETDLSIATPRELALIDATQILSKAKPIIEAKERKKIGEQLGKMITRIKRGLPFEFPTLEKFIELLKSGGEVQGD